MFTAQALVARFLALACAIVALLLVLGYFPTRRFGGEEALSAMFAGCAVGLVASLAGTIPVLAARRKSHVEMVPAALVATGVRLGVAIVLGTAVALSGKFDPKPLLLWVVISHGGLLIADTMLSIKVLSKRELAEK